MSALVCRVKAGCGFRVGLRIVREFGRRLLGAVGSACPMCEGRAHGGGLCQGCLDDVLATMHPSQPRCSRCALRLRTAQQDCPDCERHRPALARTVAAFDYEAPADVLIARFKNERCYALAGLLADLILRGWIPNPRRWKAEAAEEKSTAEISGASPAPLFLVPIPSSRASLRRRGFNPAGELARALALRTGLPLQRRWLQRVGLGPKQSTLGREARMRGAVGMYACPVRLPPCRIVLVDDVMTTGSTLDSAARALLAAGAQEITALVAARAPVEDGGTLAQYRLP